jgi:hypothetical protein
MPVLDNEPEASDAPLGRIAPPAPPPQASPEEQEATERYHTLDPTQPEFLDRAAAALRIGMPEIQAGVRAVTEEQPSPVAQPGYNFLDYIPPGVLEQYGSRYVHTENPAQAAQVTEQIRSELADQAIIARSGWTGQAAVFSAGAADPVNLATMALVPEAAPTRLGNMVRWGLTNAATTAAQEALRADTTQTFKPGEGAFNVSANAVLGGLLGSIAPRVPKAMLGRLADELHGDLYRPTAAAVPAVQPGAEIKFPETLPPDMLVPKRASIEAAREPAMPAVEAPQRPPPHEVTHTVEEETGEHTFTTANGELHATEREDALKLDRIDVAEKDAAGNPARGVKDVNGNSEAMAMMLRAEKEAETRGKPLISDKSVSPDQQRVYEGLERRGFEVERNPNAERNPETGNLISDDPRNPVFTVRPKEAGAEVPPLEEQPLPGALPGEPTYMPEELRPQAAAVVNPEAASTMGAAAVQGPTKEGLTTARGGRLYTATVGKVAVAGRLIRASSVKARELLTQLANIPGMLEQNFHGVANPNPIERILWKYDGLHVTNMKMRQQLYRDYAVRVKGEGKVPMSRRDFMEGVSQAMRRGDAHPVPEIAKAARQTREKAFTPLWERAVKGGMVPEDAKLYAQSYLTRLYDGPKIRANFDEWIERLRQGFIQKHGVEPAEAATIAHEVSRNIMGGERGTMDWHAMDGIVPQSGRMKGRTLPLPDEWLEPFLTNDIDHLEHSYLRTMAPEVEMTERFGSRDLKDQLGGIADEYTHLSEQARATGDEAKARSLAEEAVSVNKQLQAVRDRLYGIYGAPKDPGHWAVRAGRFARSGNVMRLLGAATLAHFPDLANVISRYGMPQTFAAMAKLATSSTAFKLGLREAQRLGAAIDMTMNISASLLGDYGTHSRYLEQRVMGQVTRALTIATGETPLITLTQALTSTLAQHEILKVADKVAAGGALRPNLAAKLAAGGLDTGMLKQISAAAKGTTQTVNGLRFGMSEGWADKGAAQAFESAILREAHGVTLRPGVGDTPLLMSSEWGKLILQFKTFAFAASRVVGTPLLQGLAHGDLRTVESLSALVAMGTLSYIAKQKAAGQEIETNPGRLAGEVLDKSNLLGWTGEVIFPSLWLAGFKDLSRWSDRSPYETIGGPTVGTLGDLWGHQYPARLANLATGGRVAPGQEDLPFRRSDLHFLRRMAWGQNIWYARKGINALEDGVGDLFNLPGESNAERSERFAQNPTIQ